VEWASRVHQMTYRMRTHGVTHASGWPGSWEDEKQGQTNHERRREPEKETSRMNAVGYRLLGKNSQNALSECARPRKSHAAMLQQCQVLGLRCATPMPSSCAMAMARRDSIVVSMAADIRGVDSVIHFVS
jgi:hypothetical protein